MDAGGSGEDCDSWLDDDEQMMAILSSSLSPPPQALPPSPSWSPTELFQRMPPSPPWSPTELFQRMPPSPPGPVGFLRLSNLDDEYMLLPLQVAPCPTQTDLAVATLVATAGIIYGGIIEPSSEKLNHAKRKWERDLSLFENSRNSSCILKERLTQALRYLQRFSDDRHPLIQVWIPVETERGYVLTTSGQPFLLDHQSIGLLQYRAVSMMYTFCIDSTSPREWGLPGRVFKHKVAEWTPNVQYYSSDEYPLLNHAISYNIHGTFALPVFDPLTESCIAVVELITTSKRTDYADEVNKICKALEEVDLTSTNILDSPNVQVYDGGRQSALVDIMNILSVVCETHKLPLAQTWVPCNSRSVTPHGGGAKRSCLCLTGRHVNKVCLSTCNFAFYVKDAHMWGFRDACTEHLLHKGRGVSWRAFLSRRPCFSEDVAQFCKQEYPLVHDARMFGLAACFAVCMQSSHTGDDVYILEFFLPPRCREGADQKALLESISALMKHSGGSLKAAADGDFGSLQDSELFVIEDENLNETDAQNSGGRQCESTLLLDRRSRSPERVRGSDRNCAASMHIVQHQFSGDLTNAGKSRGKSEVWQYFMKVGGRAYCKHCSKDYASDSRKHGTSRLWRHLADAHKLKVAVEADSNSLYSSDMTVTEKELLKETNSKNSQSRHCESLGYSTCNTVVSTDVQYKLSEENKNADKSRTKSEVWQHFTKDGALAYCRYCSKVYEADSRKNGTSRLWRHLAGVHRINRGSCC